MKRLICLMFVAMLALPIQAQAADLLIAQAANFMPAMKEIIPAFEAETGIKAQATYASTGKLYGQITNGAPFDIFLAADERRPKKLHADGACAEPFVYAKGQLVFWSLNKNLCDKPWQEAVLSGEAGVVGIANTETAPYGTVAMVAMQKEGVWEKVQPKLVFGQTIAQVFQFAVTGSSDAGFCAYSSVFTDQGAKGCFTVVEQAPPVIQAACVLNNAPNPEAAAKFVKFLGSAKVQAIKEKYGYR